MKIKEEYLDLQVSSPFNGKTYWLRELEPVEYIYWFKCGYDYIFEDVIVEDNFFTCEECGERMDDCDCDENKAKVDVIS